MARHTPQARTRVAATDDNDLETDLSISDEDTNDEDEDEDEDEDRGDTVTGSSDDDDDDDDDDGDGDGEDDDDDDDDADEDDDDSDDDGDEDEEDDDDPIDPETLRQIGGTGTVPLSRLNEVLEENRLLRIAAGQAGNGGTGGTATPADQQQPPAFDLKAKVKERNAKLLEGDEEAAADLDLEILEYQKQKAREEAAADLQRQSQQEKLNAAVADVQRLYPELNDRKRKYSQERLDEVIALRNTYAQRGMALDEALRKAAARLCKPGRQQGDDDAGGRKSGERGERSVRELRRAMNRAQRTPPSIGRQGTGGRPQAGAAELSERDLVRMSDKKFKALDARTLAEARGDFVGKSSRRKRS
jgi:hypothetical protein